MRAPLELLRIIIIWGYSRKFPPSGKMLVYQIVSFVLMLPSGQTRLGSSRLISGGQKWLNFNLNGVNYS